MNVNAEEARIVQVLMEDNDKPKKVDSILSLISLSWWLSWKKFVGYFPNDLNWLSSVSDSFVKVTTKMESRVTNGIPTRDPSTTSVLYRSSPALRFLHISYRLF